MEKRYTHDCDRCHFLGQHEEFDLYYCPGEPTIVCRYGDEGGEYGSGLVFAITSKKTCYREALIRALQISEFRKQIVHYFNKYESEFPERINRFNEILSGIKKNRY